ncbi:pyruvate kinase [Megasphaera sp.]|uniref:pyruvate kinase n=1 Tax=Megasphaera sp. TaxID=2023260 RepID=UPI003520C65D
MEQEIYTSTKELYDVLYKLRHDVLTRGDALFQHWLPHIQRTRFVYSAWNLAFYLALRCHDLRKIQRSLLPLGIMIARGDLAVEVGYRRLAELQEEIMWICEAAHVPVIWATQVLENLVKTGLPSRAEITDAAMGERAECVMLNKGPYIVEAVSVLTNILQRMETHQYKKTSQLRALHIAENVFNKDTY